MKYYTIDTPEKLAHIVRLFWVLEGEATEEAPFLHRALAGNSAELIFYYKGGFMLESNRGKSNTSLSAVYGQNQQFYKLKTSADFGLFGVCLYPYAIPLLFSLPADELTNQMPDMASLLKWEGAILEERIISATNTKSRIEIISEFIEQKLNSAKQQDKAITDVLKNLVNNYSQLPIKDLAGDCCLSRRQFERKFKVLSGFSPKEFLRVTRFATVVNASPLQNKSLTALAVEAGYYDQSHFIHDFRKFSGYSPKEFFKQKMDAETYRASVEFRE